MNTFDELKKSKIAFDDFDEARIHINRHWEEIDLWWKQKNVQSAKEMFLTNFCNVKSDWFKEWSDYIYFTSSNFIKEINRTEKEN